MSRGKLIVVSAPSGSGKTSIVKQLLASDLPLGFSVSATSRKPRVGEIHGVDYYFFTPEEFKLKIDNQEFIEWEEVYPGIFYGTLRSELERIWSEGKHILFDVDVKGGINIKALFKEACLAIFIMVPSMEELEKRLRNRSTESDEIIRQRLEKATYEMTFSTQFDHIVINDVLQRAVDETYQLIKTFLQK